MSGRDLNSPVECDSSNAAEGIGLLADEINQFAMSVEKYAHEGSHFIGSGRLNDRDAGLLTAARRLRERIAELIPDE